MRRLVIALLAVTLPCSAEIIMSIGPRTRYNDQFTGVNSWPNNGRHIDDDSGRFTWCSDGVQYGIMNDGNGPNDSLVSGRNIFIVSISDNFTGPAGGQLYTMRNSMDSYGTITQLNTNGWSDNKSWKTEGLHCEGAMYASVYRQGGVRFSDGSLVKSLDGGLTWCNPSHTNHTTGACTVTPSATGDAPTVGQQMFEFTLMRGLQFVQYGQDNASTSVVEGNDVWTYAYLLGQTDPDRYLVRVRHADLPLLDETKFQFYKGSGSSTSDASWSTDQADKVSLVGGSNLISNVMHIRETGYYIMEAIVANQDAVFFASRSVTGPYLEVARIVYNGDPSQLQAWFSPIIKSISTVPSGSNWVTTVLFVSGWSVNGRTGNAATSNYSQFNNFATITSSAPTSFSISGKATISGKVTIQ